MKKWCGLCVVQEQKEKTGTVLLASKDCWNRDVAEEIEGLELIGA